MNNISGGAFLKKNSGFMIFLSAIFLILLVSACTGSPTATPPSESGNYNFASLDLKTLILKPDDMKDLFSTASMSISQGTDGKNVRNLKVTYPTNSIEHTIAFSEGFETNVEVYSTAARAQAKLKSLAAEQAKTYKKVSGFDGNRQVFLGDLISPENFDTGNQEYVILVLNQNVLYTIRVRGAAGFKMPEQRIGQLIDVMVARLPK